MGLVSMSTTGELNENVVLVFNSLGYGEYIIGVRLNAKDELVFYVEELNELVCVDCGIMRNYYGKGYLQSKMLGLINKIKQSILDKQTVKVPNWDLEG